MNMQPIGPIEASSVTDHWRRTWLALLLDAAARAGLTPVEQGTIHRAAYLANALAPVYRLRVEQGLITRWKRGPFYAELQWDLDRLAILGLASFHQFSYVEDEEGWWFSISYSAGPRLSAFLEAVWHDPEVRRVARFHRELMAAIATLPEGGARWAAIADANYSNIVDGDLEAEEVVVDFAEYKERNYSVRTVGHMDDKLPEGMDLNERDRIHLYLSYLARRSKALRP